MNLFVLLKTHLNGTTRYNKLTSQQIEFFYAEVFYYYYYFYFSPISSTFFLCCYIFVFIVGCIVFLCLSVGSFVSFYIFFSSMALCALIHCGSEKESTNSIVPMIRIIIVIIMYTNNKEGDCRQILYNNHFFSSFNFIVIYDL